MKAYAKILRNHPFFSRFSSRTLNRLTAHASIVEFAKGETVYQAGDPADAMYVVLSGRCQAQVLMPDGTEQIVHIYPPGEIFGERALVVGERLWATIRVITDSVLLRIAGKDVDFLLDKSPPLARSLVTRLINQLDTYRSAPEPGDLGRVVVFVGTSRGVMSSVIAENTARALHYETLGTVAYCRFEHDPSSPMLEDWKRLYPQIATGKTVNPEGVDKVRISVSGDPREPELAAPIISHLAGHYQYLVVEMGPEVTAELIQEFIKQADMAYILLRQKPEDLYKANLFMRMAREQPVENFTRVLPLVCLEDGERALSFETLKEKVGHDVHGTIHELPANTAGDTHHHVLDHPNGRFSYHIRKLAREIGRCQIGLALSSGGAKGYSFVGTIKVLEENDIHVDMVVGTSIGGYIGTLWAYGLSADDLVDLALEMAGMWPIVRLLDPVIPPRRGFVRGDRIEDHIRKTIGDAHFSDMMRQLRIMSTDLNTLERVVFNSGEVAPCVHASIAMPGVMVPVEHMGRTCIDGGIADPLPVNVLIEEGIEKIIAINTIPPPEVMRTRVETGREVAEMPRKYAKSVRSLNQLVNYFAPGNILDIMMRGIHGAQTRVSEGACQQADVVLRPVVPDGKWHDFGNPQKYIDLGRKIAEEHMEEIRSLVKRNSKT